MNQYSLEITVAAALALLMVALAVFAPHFFQWQPFISRLTSQMPALVAAIGIALIIICRQIDISIGAQFSMCAIVAGVTAASGLPLGVAILAALGAEALMGALNGVLVAYLGLPSETKSYVKEGVTRAVILWKVEDLGYLAVIAGAAVAKSGLTPGAAEFPAGKPGKMPVTGDNIVLGKPFVFTKENIDHYDF